MARLKLYVEFDAMLDIPLEGVGPGTRDYDVQQHRPEVLEEIERRLAEAFGEGEYRLVNFEFGLAEGVALEDTPEGAR